MATYTVKLNTGKKVTREMANPITARNQAEDMAARNEAWMGSRWSEIGGDRFSVGPDGRVPAECWPGGRPRVTQYDIDRASDGR